MQELFELLAEYNRELLDILAAQPAELAVRPAGAYHGSMQCVPSHVQQEDVVWMQRFAQQLPELEPLERELPCYVAEGPVQPPTKSPRREFWNLEKSPNVRFRRVSFLPWVAGGQRPPSPTVTSGRRTSRNTQDHGGNETQRPA